MFTVCDEKWKVSGRITVEVALLLPTIVFLLVWLVFFMVFLLDMSILKSEVIRLADETSVIWDKDGELETGRYEQTITENSIEGLLSAADIKGLENDAVARLKERMKKRLMMTSSKSLHVDIGSKNVTVRGTVSFHLPFPDSGFLELHGLQFTGKAVAPVNNWQEYLWVSSAAEDALTQKRNKAADK